ncbi:hypothetical protein QOT17_007143 [Balamuthia mandrillaris]
MEVIATSRNPSSVSGASSAVASSSTSASSCSSSSSSSAAHNTQTFVMWNNKGGVGKSTLTFNIVCEYARQFPDRKVLVMDMCPQANSTSFFLGGGPSGFRAAEELMSEGRTTIARYIGENLDQQMKRPAQDYLIQPKNYSDYVPENVYLLPGDNKLDMIASQLEDKAGVKTVLKGSPQPYYVVHTMMRRFIEEVTSQNDGGAASWVVFADTNPAFTVYTRMALCSCDKLLVPCNPDDFSVNAVKMITDLLCGAIAPAPYSFTTFAKKAAKYGLPLPKLRLVIANRFLVREGMTPRLYKGTQDRLSNTVLSVLKNDQNKDFLYPLQTSADSTITGMSVTVGQFSDFYTTVVPLFHSAGVFSSYSGIPMSFMLPGDKEIEGKKTKIGVCPLISAGWAIQDIIALLEGNTERKTYIAPRTAQKRVMRVRPVPQTFNQRTLDCIDRTQVEVIVEEVCSDQEDPLQGKRKRSVQHGVDRTANSGPAEELQGTGWDVETDEEEKEKETEQRPKRIRLQARRSSRSNKRSEKPNKTK